MTPGVKAEEQRFFPPWVGESVPKEHRAPRGKHQQQHLQLGARPVEPALPNGWQQTQLSGQQHVF